MENKPRTDARRQIPEWARIRLWHFVLFVMLVAIAITDLKDQRIDDRFLLGLAVVGLIFYALIGWFGWWAVQRFQARVGPLLLIVLYCIAMSGLFLVATVMYLMIAHYYRGKNI